MGEARRRVVEIVKQMAPSEVVEAIGGGYLETFLQAKLPPLHRVRGRAGDPGPGAPSPFRTKIVYGVVDEEKKFTPHLNIAQAYVDAQKRRAGVAGALMRAKDWAALRIGLISAARRGR